MKRVLVVDDTIFMRMSIKTMVEKNGYEVVGEAENGIVAIEKYSLLKPDIVTLDITMPEMDGLEALRQIIKIDPKAKVIMVTALGQESHVREAVLIGAKGFVVKPITEEHLIKTLNIL
jgi:two-component system chemotaxis response regulator CheY